MNYTRSPLKERHNQYKHIKNQFDHKKQKEPSTPYRQQHSYKKNNYLQRSSNDKNNVSEFLLGPNYIHTKSQIIHEQENTFDQKYDYQYTKSHRNQHKIIPNNRVNEQRKFNAKQAQIQCKISKIHNYQNKIQSLLDFIRTATPNKNIDKSKSYLPSRSVTKMTTPIAQKQTKYQYYNHRQNSKSHNRLTQQHNERQKSYSVSNYKKQPEVQKQPVEIQQTIRINKYFRNQSDIIEEKRKKSRQFMKNIQGEVKQIKNTVEELNQKIKKVDYPFKKEIVLDLSSSNPQSLKQSGQFKINQNKVKQQPQDFKRHYDFDHQRKDKSISKYEQYKMMRRNQNEQRNIQTFQINNKKTGYIYTFKE